MDIDPFPPLSASDRHGLLAMGGDLSPERLLLAYRSGIFPWFNPGEPILWWSPDPRCVIYPHRFIPSRSLRKSVQNRGYKVTYDTAFEQVIECCAGNRKNQPGTWITEEMLKAYCALFHLGVAHSVEAWHNNALVGGLYGLALGKVFFGESMFSKKTDASKVALTTLMQKLVNCGFTLIDCQVSSPHMLSLGAVEIPREVFTKHLQANLPADWTASNWAAHR